MIEILKCKYCGRVCKNRNSLAQHEIRCKENPNRIKIKSNSSNFIEYNKLVKLGKRKASNQFIKAKELGLPKPIITEETREKLGRTWRGKTLPTQMKEKISEGMQRAVRLYPDSYSSSNVNGRVKKVIYKDIILDSQWEVDFAIWLDEKQIVWERPNKGFEYIYEDKKHIYYPDFYLPQLDIYVEVKGYKRERDEYKWKSLHNLIVVSATDIKRIKDNTFDLFGLVTQGSEWWSHKPKVVGSSPTGPTK